MCPDGTGFSGASANATENGSGGRKGYEKTLMVFRYFALQPLLFRWREAEKINRTFSVVLMGDSGRSAWDLM